jgi:phage shock protein PspC (stress-responsive transcriptional regulator)
VLAVRSEPVELRRSRSDRAIAGVCGGIARYFQLDSSLVRLVVVLLFLFGGLSFWVYIIMWLVIPEESLQK